MRGPAARFVIAITVLSGACATPPSPTIPPAPASVESIELAERLTQAMTKACPDGRVSLLELAPRRRARFAEFTTDGFLILEPAVVRCASDGPALTIEPTLYGLLATGRSSAYQLKDFERIQTEVRCEAGEKTVDFQLITSEKGIGPALNYPQTPGGRITAGDSKRFSFIRRLACHAPST